MKHLFYFTNLVLKDAWIQHFELLPIRCKQHNVFDSNFNGRCPSCEGRSSYINSLTLEEPKLVNDRAAW
jgi:hypothetical protein